MRTFSIASAPYDAPSLLVVMGLVSMTHLMHTHGCISPPTPLPCISHLLPSPILFPLWYMMASSMDDVISMNIYLPSQFYP